MGGRYNAQTLATRVLLTALCLFASSPDAFGQQKGSLLADSSVRVSDKKAETRTGALYAIKPADVVVPEGVPLGKYRRIIEPHPNWTLICDENLREKKRVCNISQQIVDRAGDVVFSWSLAATGNGKPMMILRAPAIVGADAAIRLSFPDKLQSIVATTSGCDAKVCVAMLPVGPRLKKYISGGTTVQVFLSLGPTTNEVVFTTTFEGLNDALSAI